MWVEKGPAGFFVGLGSRCLWSGSIISGQFLLYDAFKNLLHVTQVGWVCRTPLESGLGQGYGAALPNSSSYLFVSQF